MSYYGGGTSDNDARQKAASASNDASSAKREVAEAANDLARMKLACAAVWELLKDKTGLTENDLMLKMAEIDARDGVIDGKLNRGVRKCVQCQRTVPAKQNKCMYCGTTQPVEHVFEGL